MHIGNVPGLSSIPQPTVTLQRVIIIVELLLQWRLDIRAHMWFDIWARLLQYSLSSSNSSRLCICMDLASDALLLVTMTSEFSMHEKPDLEIKSFLLTHQIKDKMSNQSIILRYSVMKTVTMKWKVTFAWLAYKQWQNRKAISWRI